MEKSEGKQEQVDRAQEQQLWEHRVRAEAQQAATLRREQERNEYQSRDSERQKPVRSESKAEGELGARAPREAGAERLTPTEAAVRSRQNDAQNPDATTREGRLPPEKVEATEVNLARRGEAEGRLTPYEAARIRSQQHSRRDDVLMERPEGTQTRMREPQFNRDGSFVDPEREKASVRESAARSVEHIVQKDFPLAPEKRVDHSKDLSFQDDKDFDQELKTRESKISEGDVKLTQGFYDGRDNQAFVRDEIPASQKLNDSIHEKLHQKSKSELSRRLNEGVTEYFARQESIPLKNHDRHGREILQPQSDYEKEVEIVNKLVATVGEEPFKRAYFEGNTEILKHHINHRLGEGAFEKICGSLEKREYDEASQIIHDYYER
ncbi:MAG: hypothetical protein C4567_04480 [Deltaproteobacteria bacterium]|nr:MAG: hypothetical protein C4567_04480 [Deltaproteobacteria bacterium]